MYVYIKCMGTTTARDRTKHCAHVKSDSQVHLGPYWDISVALRVECLIDATCKTSIACFDVVSCYTFATGIDVHTAGPVHPGARSVGIRGPPVQNGLRAPWTPDLRAAPPSWSRPSV